MLLMELVFLFYEKLFLLIFVGFDIRWGIFVLLLCCWYLIGILFLIDMMSVVLMCCVGCVFFVCCWCCKNVMLFCIVENGFFFLRWVRLKKLVCFCDLVLMCWRGGVFCRELVIYGGWLLLGFLWLIVVWRVWIVILVLVKVGFFFSLDIIWVGRVLLREWLMLLIINLVLFCKVEVLVLSFLVSGRVRI